jgi:toxin FitB
MYTLDTNILVYHSKGDRHVAEFLRTESEQNSFFVPTIVVVEFFGFSKMSAEAMSAFETLLPYFTIVPLWYETALLAAKLRAFPKLSLGDSIIAATALSTNSTLVTRNVRDFKKVPSLEIESL